MATPTIDGVPAAVVAVIEGVSASLVAPSRQAQIQLWYEWAVKQQSRSFYGTQINQIYGLTVAHFLLRFPLDGAMADRSPVSSESSPSNGSTTFAQIDLNSGDAAWNTTAPGNMILMLRNQLAAPSFG